MSQISTPFKSIFYGLITVLIIALIIFYATPFLAISISYIAGIVSTVAVLYIWKKFKKEIQNSFNIGKVKPAPKKEKPDYIDVEVE